MDTELKIPKFVAPESWPNTWLFGSKSRIAVDKDQSLNLHIEKMTTGTAHIALNAETKDFTQVREPRGVPVGADACYSIEVRTSLNTLSSTSLVIHEFDSARRRIGRVMLQLNKPYRYVPHPQATILVISLRLKGAGKVTLQDVKIIALDDSHKMEPGIHIESDQALPAHKADNNTNIKHSVTLDEITNETAQLQMIVALAVKKIESVEAKIREYREEFAAVTENQLSGDIHALIKSQRQLEMQIRSSLHARKTN